jgi:hypothetical protein
MTRQFLASGGFGGEPADPGPAQGVDRGHAREDVTLTSKVKVASGSEYPRETPMAHASLGGKDVNEPEHACLPWRKSSACDEGDGCVEVAVSSEAVYMRNSRHRGGPVLEFLHQEWIAFLAGVRKGEFELPTPPAPAEAD